MKDIKIVKLSVGMREEMSTENKKKAIALHLEKVSEYFLKELEDDDLKSLYVYTVMEPSPLKAYIDEKKLASFGPPGPLYMGAPRK